MNRLFLLFITFSSTLSGADSDNESTFGISSSTRPPSPASNDSVEAPSSARSATADPFIVLSHEAITQALQDIRYSFPLAYKHSESTCTQIVQDAYEHAWHDEENDLVNLNKMFSYLKEKITPIEERQEKRWQLAVKKNPGKSCARLSCKHIFHKRCILTFLHAHQQTYENQTTCPLCKKPYVKDDIRYIPLRRTKQKKHCAICFTRLR